MSLTDYVIMPGADYQAICNAVRSKNGETGVYKSGELATAIEAVTSGIEPEFYTFDQRREEVASFLDNVEYNPNDYTVSQIADYVTSTGANYPNGVAINIKESGTLVVVDGYTKGSIKKSVVTGNYTIYNCTPNVDSTFLLLNNKGDIVQSGTIRPTGACRMLYIPNIWNVRDLGGWACDGGTVKYGKLFRGGDPYTYLTDEGYDTCINFLKIQKEINLLFESDINGRTESSFGKNVDMTWVDMTWNDLAYQKSSGNTKAIFNALFDCVINGRPTFFHCSAGADRTGVVALICEAILGVSQSDIDKDYELTNFFTGVGTDAKERRRNETGWTRELNIINSYSGDTFRDRTVNYLISCGITLEKINAFRKAMIDGTPDDVVADVGTYTITSTMSDVESDNSDTSVTQFQPYFANITPSEGKIIESIEVLMDGINITSKVFRGIETTLNRKVTKTLTNCISSNLRCYAIDGQSYVTSLICDDGYDLGEGATVTITMGGVDVSTYYKNGIISIPEVTGDIEIIATAIPQATKYVNQLDNAVDFDGNVIGHTPLYANMRFNSSSGDPVTYDGYNITGLIACKQGDTIRIRWTGKNDNTYQQIKLYKSDFSQCTKGYISFLNLPNHGEVIQYDASNGILDFTLKSNDTAPSDAYTAYIAIVLYGALDDVIVTVNEDII